MKSLILMRHAKSKSNFEGLDIDRPLSKFGKASLPMVFNELKAYLHSEATYFVSTSIRTKQTVSLMVELMSHAKLQLNYESDLYHASFDELVQFIKSIDSSIEQAILIAHNPGLNQFVANSLNDDSIHFPPASFAVFSLPIENWHDFTTSNHQVVHLFNSI